MPALFWNLNCRAVSWLVERLRIIEDRKFQLSYNRKTVKKEKKTIRPRLIEDSYGTYFLTWLVVCYRKAKLGRRCGPSYQKLGLQRRRHYQVCHHDRRCTMVNLTKKNLLELSKSLFWDIDTFTSCVHGKTQVLIQNNPYIESVKDCVTFEIQHTT